MLDKLVTAVSLVLGTCQGAFLALKLFGAISWVWFLVFLPGIVFVFFIISVTGILIHSLEDSTDD